MASGECVADGGGARGRALELPGHWPGSLVGGRRGGPASGPRVRARPAGTPLPTHLIPTQVPAILRLAEAGRPRTGRRCGSPP